MSTDKKVILDVSDLKVHFSIAAKSAWPWAKPANLKAVDGVNVRLYEGETLGVVGESGCGKSTFARAIIGLVEATDGEVVWLGHRSYQDAGSSAPRNAQRNSDDFSRSLGIIESTYDHRRYYC